MFSFGATRRCRSWRRCCRSTRRMATTTWPNKVSPCNLSAFARTFTRRRHEDGMKKPRAALRQQQRSAIIERADVIHATTRGSTSGKCCSGDWLWCGRRRAASDLVPTPIIAGPAPACTETYLVVGPLQDGGRSQTVSQPTCARDSCGSLFRCASHSASLQRAFPVRARPADGSGVDR